MDARISLKVSLESFVKGCLLLLWTQSESSIFLYPYCFKENLKKNQTRSEHVVCSWTKKIAAIIFLEGFHSNMPRHSVTSAYLNQEMVGFIILQTVTKERLLSILSEGIRLLQSPNHSVTKKFFITCLQ